MAVPGATDWADYYRRPGTGTRFSRFWVGRRLLDIIRFALGAAGVLGPLSVVEYGGANSCFLPSILASLPVRRYTIVDTNPLGLMLTRQRWAGHTVVEAREGDVLAELPEDLRADLVFSVGLIEHFDAAGTAQALHTHLQATRPGGVCLLSYPTPTLLYRVARRIAELTGQWRFHDERPLRLEEIKPTVDAYGSLITTQLIWPIIFTQQMIAIVRRAPAGASPNNPIPGITRTTKSQTAPSDPTVLVAKPH
jgi:SAM-dependent methyltransferase